MDNATRNANNFLETMQLQYNKARQTKITKELTELASAFESSFYKITGLVTYKSNEVNKFSHVYRHISLHKTKRIITNIIQEIWLKDCQSLLAENKCFI